MTVVWAAVFCVGLEANLNLRIPSACIAARAFFCSNSCWAIAAAVAPVTMPPVPLVFAAVSMPILCPLEGIRVAVFALGLVCPASAAETAPVTNPPTALRFAASSASA